MDSNVLNLGAAPDLAVSLHSEGRWDGSSAVAETAGEFGAQLVRAIRAGLAQGPGAAREHRPAQQGRSPTIITATAAQVSLIGGSFALTDL